MVKKPQKGENMFKMHCEVLKVSQKISKAGKQYNQVILGLPGQYEKISMFLPEALIPDFVEGKRLEVEFEVTFRNWRPDLRIKGVVK